MNASRQPSRKSHLYSIKTDWVDTENDRQYDLTPVSALTKSYSHAKSPSGYSLDPWEVDDEDDDEDEALPRPAPSNAIGDSSKQQLNSDDARYVRPNKVSGTGRIGLDFRVQLTSQHLSVQKCA
jgi:hypothetical protein